MFAFLKYVFTPKLLKEYNVGPCQVLYEPSSMEKWGDQIMSTISLVWNIGYYTSPIILTYLFRRGYFIADSFSYLVKLTAGLGILIAASVCLRSIGRSQSCSYVKFAKAFQQYKTKPCSETRKALTRFDFDFRCWPVDFESTNVRHSKKGFLLRPKSLWMSSLPCEFAAYVAIHTFGIRMIYPGCVKVLQKFLEPVLIQGRCRLIEQERASRYKLKTADFIETDTVFIDNRGRSENGEILVICSEGNAGFYEIGIMTTPLSLRYSVIGWNHPGFAGSTGLPFPSQDENSIDVIMKFAITYLGFSVENIILFGWSIGAYSTLWAAINYPDVKGIILDATFDDLLQLATYRMPKIFSNVVKLAIRGYVNLNHTELLNNFNGPVLMIRRTEDEIITTDENNIETNRGNYLLVNMLKCRYPNIFKLSQVEFVYKLLSKSLKETKEIFDESQCFLLLNSYVSTNGKAFPFQLGENLSEEQRFQLSDFLVREHMRDLKSTHCTPLPLDLFEMPWTL